MKEVCGITGLSSSALRYYEEEGILKNVGRTENKQRIYVDKHLRILGTLKCFKGTGMSMRQLKQFFSYEEEEMEHLDEILDLLAGQRESVLKEMEQLKLDLDKVERKIHYYGDMKRAREEGETLPEWSAYKECAYKECQKE